MSYGYAGPNAESEAGLSEDYRKIEKRVITDCKYMNDNRYICSHVRSIVERNNELNKKMFQLEKERADLVLREIMRCKRMP